MTRFIEPPTANPGVRGTAQSPHSHRERTQKNCPGQRAVCGELCWYSSCCSSFILIHTRIIPTRKGKTSSFNSTSRIEVGVCISLIRDLRHLPTAEFISVRSQLLPTHFLVSVRLSVLYLISYTSAACQTHPPGLSWAVTDTQQSPHPSSTCPDLSDLSFPALPTAEWITTTHAFCPYNESQWGPKQHWTTLTFIVWT